MRKLIALFILFSLYTSNVWANTSFIVHVSFTIPQHIEIQDPCHGNKLNDGAINTSNTITTQQTVLRNDNVCQLTTVLPK